MIEWKRATEERFYDMLGAVPPASRGGNANTDAFQVGEASNHDSAGNPTFATFKRVGDEFSESVRPATWEQFANEFESATLYYR